MNFDKLLQRAARFTTNNSPTILTAAAVLGVVTTAYLVARATFKASDVIRNYESTARGLTGDDEYLATNQQKFKEVWRLYIPAVGMGACTVACVLTANRIGNKRAAALAAAYAISDRAFEEYKSKVVEKLGQKKETAVRDEIAQDRVTNSPPPAASNQVIVTIGEVLMMDGYSGRYFMGSIEGVNRAVNQLNHELNTTFSASLTDFYYMIGLPPTKLSDEVGWNADKLLTVDHSATISPDGRPCIVMNFRTQPLPRYSHVG